MIPKKYVEILDIDWDTEMDMPVEHWKEGVSIQQQEVLVNKLNDFIKELIWMKKVNRTNLQRKTLVTYEMIFNLLKVEKDNKELTEMSQALKTEIEDYLLNCEKEVLNAETRLKNVQMVIAELKARRKKKVAEERTMAMKGWE